MNSVAVRAAASLIALSGAFVAAVDIQIIHWNDVHARTSPASESSQQLCLEEPYEDESCYGGHARLATICQEAKAAMPGKTLCIDAGDEFLGTVWDSLFSGQQNIETLTMVGTDVMTTGNHEFDYGVQALASFVDAVPFPVLGACNMDLAGEPSLNIKKWTILDMNGTKVGLLGYIAGDTGSLSSAGGVNFTDPLEAMPGCYEDFMVGEGMGVDIVGFVSHAGLSVDEKMAALIPGVDFIVSAHSHTPMFADKLGACLEIVNGTCGAQDDSSVEYPYVVEGVPILQQYYASKYAGVVTLSFDDAGELTASEGKSVALGASYDADGVMTTVEASAEIIELLKVNFQEVLEFSNSTVGELPVALSAGRPDIRVQEMALGNLVCDSIIDALLQSGFKEGEGVPILCLTNGGGIRADLPMGKVTYGDVLTVLPFGNTIEVLEITGALLKETLEFAYAEADNLEDPPGKFAHLGGGLSAVLDLSQPALSRIVGLYVACTTVQDGHVFHLATNNFVAGGGDDYTMLAGLPRVLSFGPSLATGLSDYIKANTPEGGEMPLELVDVEGRIAKVAADDVPLCATAPLAATAPASVDSLAPASVNSLAPPSVDSLAPVPASSFGPAVIEEQSRETTTSVAPAAASTAFFGTAMLAVAAFM